MKTRVVLGLTMGALVLLAALNAVPAETELDIVRPPSSSDAIDAYASRLQVGPPERHANLSLYPLFADGVIVPDLELTLDEAIERGLLEIAELKPAEVNRVRLISRADEPVFIMGGEMLLGAKQDRIAGDDLVVPPGAELVIPVYCVEQGRWVAKTDAFSSAGALVGSEVRKARQRADQGAVWSEVAAEQSRLNAPSETGALRSVRESEEVQDRMRPYTRALGDFARDHRKARGVVACMGSEIIAADLFGSRTVFRTLWPKLLESYVIDAFDRRGREQAPDSVRIRRWLDGITRAEKTRKPTPGAGTLYELHGGGIIGSALVYQEGVIHMELFRGYVVRPVRYNRLEFRRDRLRQHRDEEPRGQMQEEEEAPERGFRPPD
ncbi:MAG: hypothetical protein JSV79_05845 [Armatimonadota bacterium]|nr:MAG: hypothetical protein JSV79_05845 [Armatimonadota bacterium]